MNYIKWLLVLFLISLIGVVAVVLMKEEAVPPKYYADVAKTDILLQAGVISSTPGLDEKLDREFKSMCNDQTDPSCQSYLIYKWIKAELGAGKTKQQIIEQYKVDEILKYQYSLYFNNDLNNDFAWRNIHFTILAMNQLDMLSENEKNAWTVKYANHKTIILKHKSRQITLFNEVVNAKTIEDLSNIPAINIKDAISNVCSSVPELTEENDPCAALNYINFKAFCVYELNSNDKKTINKIITKEYEDSTDKEVFEVCISQVREMI